jgi:hypothetical protein
MTIAIVAAVLLATAGKGAVGGDWGIPFAMPSRLFVGIELDEQLRREVQGERGQRGLLRLVRDMTS